MLLESKTPDPEVIVSFMVQFLKAMPPSSCSQDLKSFNILIAAKDSEVRPINLLETSTDYDDKKLEYLDRVFASVRPAEHAEHRAAPEEHDHLRCCVVLRLNELLLVIVTYYMARMGLLTKSPYSAASNPNFSCWVHTIGCLLGNFRSQNATALPNIIA